MRRPAAAELVGEATPEAVFVAEDGVERRVPWEFLPEVVGELGRPVRSFPSYMPNKPFPESATSHDKDQQ